MAGQGVASVLVVLTLLVGLLASIQTVQSIGVCYGNNGNNLPPPAEVVELYKRKQIDAMRIYLPIAGMLQALRGTSISVIVDAPDVVSLSSNDVVNASSSAQAWVQNNVQPYHDVNIKYIAVGNEVRDEDKPKILPAMQNLKDALSAAGLDHIKVSTAIKMSEVASSPQPSGSVFADPSIMGPIVKFLASNGSPLLANAYPYYAYENDRKNIDLNFALFKPISTKPVDDNGKTYTNLFDAMVDSLCSALEKAGGSQVPVVLSETGWPSAGSHGANIDSAMNYNQNLINHVGKGTPKRPGPLETYIFAMFNENQKNDGIERHFGLFNPDKSPVYSINFSGTPDSSTSPSGTSHSGTQPQPRMGWASSPVLYALVIVSLSLLLLAWPVSR